MCCKPVVPTPGGKVASGDPRGGAVTGRTELLEARLGGHEGRLRVVEPVLLQQRAAEHELRVADLVEIVLVTLEQPERMLRLLGGLLRVTSPEVDLGER